MNSFLVLFCYCLCYYCVFIVNIIPDTDDCLAVAANIVLLLQIHCIRVTEVTTNNNKIEMKCSI